MSVIDDYLDGVSSPQKAALERVRAIIKQTTPDAEEVITYSMPGFKYKQKYLIAFAAFKDHMSVFPGAAPIEELQEKLRDFKQSKGTVQFTIEHPLPEALIVELLQIRMRQITG